MSSDAELAARLAEAAGRLLLAIREAGTFAPGAIGAAGDQIANAYLVAALRDARPGDAILSEEMACDGGRLDADRVWIVDPLDGTREYGEGRDDWAVHVALAVGGTAATGAVALPARRRTFRSDRPPAVAPHQGAPRMVVSRSRPPAAASRVAAALGAALRPMGSAGAKAMAVVAGEADLYLHLGGQREWDSAAPVAVARAAGLHCSRVDGSPLCYNQRDVWMPDLLICRPDLADRVIALLAGERGDG